MGKDEKQEKVILEKLNLLNNNEILSNPTAGLSSREIDLLQTNIAVQNSKNGTWAGSKSKDKNGQPAQSLRPCTTQVQQGTEHLHGPGSHSPFTNGEGLDKC